LLISQCALVMGASFCSPDLDILDSPCASFIVLRISPWWPLSWRGLMEIYSPSFMEWL
jgi:hypothetical protein